MSIAPRKALGGEGLLMLSSKVHRENREEEAEMMMMMR
jgi:hypothetical protein